VKKGYLLEKTRQKRGRQRDSPQVNMGRSRSLGEKKIRSETARKEGEGGVRKNTSRSSRKRSERAGKKAQFVQPAPGKNRGLVAQRIKRSLS